MALSIVGVTQGTSPDVAITPTGTASGDLLLFYCTLTDDPSGTITPPAGATLVKRQDHTTFTSDQISVAIYQLALSGTPAGTYTFTVGGNNISVATLAIRGAASTPIDSGSGAPTGADGISSAPTATGLTTGAASELLVWAWLGDDFFLSSGPSGFTAQIDGTSKTTLDGFAYGLYTKVASSAGATGNISAAAAGSDDWAVLLVAVVPAGGGAAVIDDAGPLPFIPIDLAPDWRRPLIQFDELSSTSGARDDDPSFGPTLASLDALVPRSLPFVDDLSARVPVDDVSGPSELEPIPDAPAASLPYTDDLTQACLDDSAPPPLTVLVDTPPRLGPAHVEEFPTTTTIADDDPSIVQARAVDGPPITLPGADELTVTGLDDDAIPPTRSADPPPVPTPDTQGDDIAPTTIVDDDAPGPIESVAVATLPAALPVGDDLPPTATTLDDAAQPAPAPAIEVSRVYAPTADDLEQVTTQLDDDLAPPPILQVAPPLPPALPTGDERTPAAAPVDDDPGPTPLASPEPARPATLESADDAPPATTPLDDAPAPILVPAQPDPARVSLVAPDDEMARPSIDDDAPPTAPRPVDGRMVVALLGDDAPAITVLDDVYLFASPPSEGVSTARLWSAGDDAPPPVALDDIYAQIAALGLPTPLSIWLAWSDETIASPVPPGPFPSIQIITATALVRSSVTATAAVAATITITEEPMFVGDVSTIQCTVVNQFGALVDPGVVTANVRTPDGVVAAQAVTRLGTGLYSIVYTWSQQFGHFVQFQGTLPYPFNNYQEFTVLASPF